MQKNDMEPKSVGLVVDIGLGDLAEAISDVTALALPLVNSGVKLIDSLLGPGARELGLTGGEYVHRWRTKNRIETFAHVDRLLKERNIPPRILPKGFLLPAFEAIGDCEEPDLQKLWAELLASAIADAEVRHPAFIGAIKHLSAADAEVFADLVTSGKEMYLSTEPSGLPRGMPESPSMAVLRMAGLIHAETLLRQEAAVTRPQVMPLSSLVTKNVVTTFGLNFARAVGLVPHCKVVPQTERPPSRTARV